MSGKLTVDLNDPIQAVDAMMRIRSNVGEGKQSISWFAGTIFIVFPGKAPQPLFLCDGYGAGRVVKTGDHEYELLVREIMVYKNLKTGEILSEWDNPFTNRTDAVVHVANDPVNFRMSPKSIAMVKWVDLGDDIQAVIDVPLAYPNPLQPDQYPEESSGAVYSGSEHFYFHARREDIENSELTSVPSTNSWFRAAPVLPWMRMGQTDAYLLYSSSGRKLDGGYDALSQQLRDYTEANCPKYAVAPEEWTEPNQSSWTVYKKLLENRKSN